MSIPHDRAKAALQMKQPKGSVKVKKSDNFLIGAYIHCIFYGIQACVS
jgi:hypothetical protein